MFVFFCFSSVFFLKVHDGWSPKVISITLNEFFVESLKSTEKLSMLKVTNSWLTREKKVKKESIEENFSFRRDTETSVTRTQSTRFRKIISIERNDHHYDQHVVSMVKRNEENSTFDFFLAGSFKI